MSRPDSSVHNVDVDTLARERTVDAVSVKKQAVMIRLDWIPEADGLRAFYQSLRDEAAAASDQ
jgi:hypothetical protein